MIDQSQRITDLTALPATARVWVFQSSRKIEGDIRTQVSARLISFLKEWAAHGRSLFAAFEIRYDRFIIIGVDEAQAQATGCSIDKLMHTIQEIDREHEMDLLERMKVAYRDGEEINEVSANRFAEMLANGEADEQTRVFNNVVQSLEELQHKWESTVAESWHRNLLPA